MNVCVYVYVYVYVCNNNLYISTKKCKIISCDMYVVM